MGKTGNTNFIIFGLTQPWPRAHALSFKHYTTDAVLNVSSGTICVKVLHFIYGHLIFYVIHSTPASTVTARLGIQQEF